MTAPKCEDVVTIVKKVSEQRWYAVSFANTPEVISGETISQPTLIPSVPNGPTFANLQVNTTAFNGVPANKGVVFYVSGGSEGDVCDFAIAVQTSEGNELLVSGRFIITKDYGECPTDNSNPVCATVVNGYTDAELVDLANAPVQIVSDNQSVSERPLSDIIAMDKYLKAKKVTDPFQSLKLGIWIPPGTTGRQ